MLGAPCTLVRRRRVLRTEATNRSFKTLIKAERSPLTVSIPAGS